jgi:hypothetical protein
VCSELTQLTRVSVSSSSVCVGIDVAWAVGKRLPICAVSGSHRACLVWRCRRGTQRLSRSAELNFPQYNPAAIRTLVWIVSGTYFIGGMPRKSRISGSRQTLNPAHAGFSFCRASEAW